MQKAWFLVMIVSGAGLLWMPTVGTNSGAVDPLHRAAANDQELPVLAPVPDADSSPEIADVRDPFRCRNDERPVPLFPVELLREKEAELERLRSEVQHLRDQTGAAAMFDCELLVVEYARCPEQEAPHDAEVLFDAARRTFLSSMAEPQVEEVKVPGSATAKAAGPSAWPLLQQRLADLERRRLARVVAHARLSAADQTSASWTTGLGPVEELAGATEALAGRPSYFVWNALPTARGGGRVKLQTTCQLRYAPSLGWEQHENLASPGSRLALGFRTDVEIPLGQPLVVGEMRSWQDPASVEQPRPAPVGELRDQGDQQAVKTTSNPVCQHVAVAVLCVRPVAPSGGVVRLAPRGAPPHEGDSPEGRDEVIILPANADAIGPLVPIFPRF